MNHAKRVYKALRRSALCNASMSTAVLHMALGVISPELPLSGHGCSMAAIHAAVLQLYRSQHAAAAPVQRYLCYIAAKDILYAINVHTAFAAPLPVTMGPHPSAFFIAVRHTSC